MSGLPDFLKVPEGTAKLSPLPLPPACLIKFNLLPLHKATAFLNPTDYLSEYTPTVTDFDPGSVDECRRTRQIGQRNRFAPNHVKNVNRVSAAANPTPRHCRGENFEFFAFSGGFL
jgi:hypothetical protein